MSLLRAKTDRTWKRTISCGVLSSHIGSLAIAGKIAAARQIQPSMTALDPVATAKQLSPDRGF